MVNADYGLMALEKKTLEFYVFNREIKVKEEGYIQKELSDGRYAVGRVASNSIVDRVLRALRIKRGGLELKTQPEFLLKKPLDNPTKEKIKEEVLTRKCNICDNPTEYEIRFAVFRDPFGMHCGYGRRACLEHINGIIERGGKMWDVIKRGSIYHFSDIKVLGRVKYDQREKKFIPCPSIIEKIRPEESSFSLGGGLVYRFNKEKGLLEIGDKQLFERISDDISGELWKGVDIEVMLPDADMPIILSDVKRIIYTEE